MSTKSVVLLPLAEQDVYAVLEHYRDEGGAALAQRWTDAVEAALRHVAAHAASGSSRHADMLAMPGLRFWQTRHFPFLIFYVERSAQVDVLRVLHERRDLPEWLHEGE